MPPGYAGGVVENYQVFEMDQYLKASAEQNGSNQALYLEKLDPVAEFGPDYFLDNLFQIQNVDDPTTILQKQGLTAGMDIAFVVDGTLSKFRIEAVFEDSGNIYISLLNLKFDLVNLNQGGFTSEWSLDTGYDVQNDMTLVPGESTSSFYLSEVRVLNYVNTVSLETITATESFDDTAEWLPGVFLNNIAIPQSVIPVQSRDYSHLRTHRSKDLVPVDIDAPFFNPQVADYAVQFWLIREPESVNFAKGYASRAIIPAIVETDYEVRFDKIKSSYVVKK
jgi:hypothetical protein